MKPFPKGDTFAFAATVTLPPSAWTAAVSLTSTKDPRSEGSWGIVATMAPIGPNPRDAAKVDYTITLTAPAEVTAKWPVKGLQEVLDLVGRIHFVDGSGQVRSSRRFTLSVEA